MPALLPDLGSILSWKPRRAGPAALGAKARGTSASERAMTATSQQDADDCADALRRQQSTQKTDDEDESDDGGDDGAAAAAAAAARQPLHALARAKLAVLGRAAAQRHGQQPSRQSSQSSQPSEFRGPARRKPHSRSVDELSESDFLPLAAGARVSTPFGLGTVLEVRARDGATVVRLQRSHPNAVAAPATLFLRADDDDCHAVPALLGDLVLTPAGEARVAAYDARQQAYDVHLTRASAPLAGVGATCRVRASDVKRRAAGAGATGRFSRRARCLSMEGADATAGRHSSGAMAPPKLARGLSTALRSIVATSSSVSASTYNFVSSKYYQGQPVLTKFGPGTIAALQAADDAGAVTSASGASGASSRMLQVELEWGAVAFLNVDAITSYPKALVGMEVSTKFGPGVVLELRPQDAIYTVRLREEQAIGASDVVYVHESDLHRMGKLAATVGSVHKQVRGKLSALRAAAFGHERVVVMHLRDDEISSAGI